MEGAGFFTALRKYGQFHGRARRSEFWWFVIIAESLILFAATFAAIQLSPAYDDATNTFTMDDVGLLGWIFLGLTLALALVFIIPMLSVTVRRLHDTGASGAWLIFYLFLPIVVWIMALFDGTPGPNKYGPDPKGRPGAEVPAGI